MSKERIPKTVAGQAPNASPDADHDPFNLARREFLTLAAGGAAVLLASSKADGKGPAEPNTTAFRLPSLPYASDALEPFIDKMTMDIHHGKHHAAYVNNLNKAIESAPNLAGKTVEELLANNCSLVPESIRTAVRNNGAATPTTPCSGRSWAPEGRPADRSAGRGHKEYLRRFRSV